MLEVRIASRLPSFELEADFTLDQRELLHVFGPSGSGKTTLLRCIAGLRKPDTGRILYATRPWFDTTTREPPERRRVGYVSQDAQLFPHLSVRKNLEYGFARAPADARRIEPPRIAELLGLATLLERRPATLSGGERRRVAIGRAIAMNPVLLLLDEPLTGLDRENRDACIRGLKICQSELGLPIVYVTHQVEEIARLGGKMLWLEAGKIRARGPAGQLLAELELGATLGDEASTLLSATVEAHEREWGLARLSSAWGALWVPSPESTEDDVGTEVSLRVRARDVSLALRVEGSSSILNTVSAIVDSSRALGPASELVRLTCPADPSLALLSLITRKSFAELGLRPGMSVFVRIKGMSLA
jgi:molybdate transport system ATP-binding protein